MNVSAVIVAAGRGTRMGGEGNKVFLPLGGVPILAHSIEAFLSSLRVSEIVVVVRPGEEEQVGALLRRAATRRTRVVCGGAERRDSALAGVRAAGGDIVLIHDGARPFVSVELIERVIDGAIARGACVPAMPVVDTLRRIDEDARSLLPGAVERRGLVHIQTPQGFRTELIRRCLAAAAAGLPLPDDAAAVLADGTTVAVVEGDRRNIKITTPADLILAEALLASSQGRIAAPRDCG